jgi:hypothetical protein
MKKLLKSNEYKFVIDYFKSMDFKDKNIYGNWLAQTFYFVSHSVRLSALGGSKLPADSEVGKRMLAHTIEEKGHHTIALKDIAGLGKKIEDFPAFGVTNAFYQAQYYKVLFEHPYHLLGQIFMLEAFSVDVGNWMYGIVKKPHGEDCSRFVSVHTHEDIDHVKKALEVMEKFPPENKRGVEENFYQACELYFSILRSINEENFKTLSKAA